MVTLDNALADLRPHAESAGDASRGYSLLERMALLNVSAVSVAVIEHGRILEQTAGTRAADDPTPADEGTAFAACSVSKAITAVMALRMVAQGQLALDEDVNTRLRSWRLADRKGERVAVTLRQLLTHTAGTNVHGAPGYDPAEKIPSAEEVFYGRFPSLTPAVVVEAPPGSSYAYSAGGYLVVQQLLSEVAERSFADVAQELVFAPLGMRRSRFGAPPDTNHAFAHVSMIRKHSPETDLAWPEQAAAGLWSTAGDLARFGQALHRSYAGESDFLPRPLALEALTRQTSHRDIGLGLHLQGTGAARRFGHTGAHLGWRAEVMMWLVGGHGLAVMLNNGYTGSEFKAEIVSALVRHRGWSL